MPEGPRQVIVPVADMRESPGAALRGKLESQLVFGESFHVEAEEKGWCKGRSLHDGYRGWIDAAHLGAAETPTHIVVAARSHAYAEPTIKSENLKTFSFGSRVRIAEEGEKFLRLADGSWLYRKHLASLETADADHVETARKFLETPYYWGGRSGFGIDCSGLVQVSLARAGVRTERDSERQMQTLGAVAGKARRGDFVFFEGHVGIMADDRNLIHANAFHMKVAIEPLETVVARTEGITAVRRL
jgi:cell wall-associated NlpC family hydrolase